MNAPVSTLLQQQFDLEELVALAGFDIEQGQYEQALKKLKQVVTEQSPPPAALAITARLYAQLGLFNKAQLLFQAYLRHHPHAELENFQLGMSFFEQNQIEKALHYWDIVLQHNPHYAPALFYKGLALSRQNRNADAIVILEHLIKQVPGDNLYFRQAKEILNALQSGRPTAATVIPFAKEVYKSE